MSKTAAILCVLIAGELAASAIFLNRWGSTSPRKAALQPPLPDLSFLDSMTAQEVRRRQNQVASGRAEDWRALAEIYVLYGLFSEADLCCRRAADLNPESFWTYLWWGTALSRLGRTEESSEKFLAAIPRANGPLADVCRYCVGLNLLRDEKPSDAEAIFRTASGYPPAEYELAKLLTRSHRSLEAVSILDRLIEAHPQREKYLQLRARAAGQLGQKAEAATFQEQADRALEVLSSDELTGFLEEQIGKHGLDAMIEDAKELISTGNIPEAAARLRHLLEIEWRSETADLLAHAARQLGNPGEAIRLLGETMRRAGATPERLVVLGDACHLDQDGEQARELWRRAIRLGRSQAAHRRLEEDLRRQGDDDAARRHQALALMEAGITAERNQEITNAKLLLEQSIELSPGNALAWFHLGECLRLLDEPHLAEEAYRRCLEIDPNYGRAERRLEQLGSLHVAD